MKLRDLEVEGKGKIKSIANCKWLFPKLYFSTGINIGYLSLWYSIMASKHLSIQKAKIKYSNY